MTVINRRLCSVAVMPILAVLLVAPSVGAQASSTVDRQRVSVMTRNLYLGADLTPVLSAANPITGIVSVVNAVAATDPAARMAAVAREIAARHPLLVGLQEVASWTVVGKDPLDNTKQLVPAASYDFLAMLRKALVADHAPYRVVVAQTNFDSTKQLPPLLESLARFTDRDVILARSDVPASQLKVIRTHARHYTHQLSLPVTALGSTVDFDRGYEWADVNTGGVVWRFVNTHPEAYTPAQLGLPGKDVNGPQARELASALKGVTKPTVIVADLNSARNETDRTAYTVLTGAGFGDTWLALGRPNTANTCCRDGVLSSGSLTTRIDHVLARGTITPLSARRIGVAPTSSTPPRWPTDHAGVFTRLSIRG